MEEQALYQAILAAPHDDTPRLVYADWLDDNADAFGGPLAKAEHARAELIRLQCQIARRAPNGWNEWSENRSAPIDSALLKRHKRLAFQHGKKWRGWFPKMLASAPFDRGFLRPFRAMRPQEFLERISFLSTPFRLNLPPLSADSPVWRYVPPGSTFHACPLWDIHLYATPFVWDALADRGQYADLLTEAGRHPNMARVGWLKVTFFGTPIVNFLRMGHFENVETLVLNAGPFPEVLVAITENESFRNLRYIHFGDDRGAWILDYPTALRFNALHDKIRTANARHLPHGEMRTVLRSILSNTPLVPAAPPPPTPLPNAYTAFDSARRSAASVALEPSFPVFRTLLCFGWLFFMVVKCLFTTSTAPTPSQPQLQLPVSRQPFEQQWKPPELRQFPPAEKKPPPNFVGPPRPVEPEPPDEPTNGTPKR